MKRKLFFAIALSTTTLPLFAFAVGPQNYQVTTPTGKLGDWNSLITLLIQASYWIVVPGIALAIIYAGFLFATSSGDKKKIDKAKAVMKGAVIAAAVAFAAEVIKTIVVSTGNAVLGQ